MSVQSEINNTIIQNEEPHASTITETEALTECTLRLKLTKSSKTKSNRRVSWTTETVDNEFMNKKKSKCCCIYHKPKSWNESSSEDENEDHECEHCKGHRKSDFNKKKESEKHHENESNCDVNSNQQSNQESNN